MLILSGCAPQAAQPAPPKPTIEVILSDLENPRGLALGPGGELYVTEAGTGHNAVESTELTGKLTLYRDLNRDGDFEDPAEAERWFSHLPTYNSLQVFRTHRDEVSGPADVLLHQDGRIFLSVDGGLDDIGLFVISPGGRVGRNLYTRSNMNGIEFDQSQEKIYVAASTANQLIEIGLDGSARDILTFPLLGSGQQAVPAGLTVDPRNGDIWVALFSGAVESNVTGEVIPFVPGDSKVVRVDAGTGEIVREITGLTTAIDVAVDEVGNIFILEATSGFADPLPILFDLFDPDAEPLHGGYKRFEGRLTLYPSDGGQPRVLASGLDMPTNLELGPDGSLYVSIGQGTPNRPIPGPDGPTRIVGQILRITNMVPGNLK